MKSTIRKRILVTVDGSDQALEAIRYICDIVPIDRTDIVLFNVGAGFPEVFWDMDKNPLYQSKKSGVMGWLADNQLEMGEFKHKAYKVLCDAGFTKAAISVKTQVKKAGVLKDILQESYQGYSAIVVGRTGVSPLKVLDIRQHGPEIGRERKTYTDGDCGRQAPVSQDSYRLDDSIEAMRRRQFCGGPWPVPTIRKSFFATVWTSRPCPSNLMERRITHQKRNWTGSSTTRTNSSR